MSAQVPEAGTSGDVLNFIKSNGWFITFGLILLYCLYKRYESHIRTWQGQSQARHHEVHEDPSSIISWHEALEVARRRMQERQDQLSEQHIMKQKELEEKKRQEKITNWEQVQQRGASVSRLSTRQEEQPASSSAPRRPKNSHNDDRLRGTPFNPLMGHGGGASYRPSRRNFSQGG